ncbi:hypothetical protein BKH41_08880 [Helicobacter sp. 12S02232-10]|uniref:hypothetical protein n=1 Tax=Helicobacter sp. 12S02232-10 TaxID=1476197 RepID=UPI000BA6810B|nr:hypothetical protein [Helicobacter sp. 12S02232-10]PAF46609.1 hypothetical protein BKH41_08880 [Helicobacter sp. 12S02232-10]
MIKLQHSKADLSEIHITNLYQVPIKTFEEYWTGSLEDYKTYCKNYRLDYNWNVDNLDQLHSIISDCFSGFERAINKNIGQFQFLLRSAMKPRNLPPLDTNDYMKLEIDLSMESEEQKQEIIQKFLNLTTRSFVDFRRIEDDKLIIIYNRRGIVPEEDRIAIVKAKPVITLKDNFKVSKDNNFIVSGILKDIAIPNTEFVYTYNTGSDEKDLKANSNEILEIAKFRNQKFQEQKQESFKQIEISEIAKNEIKKENQQNRQSLPLDSTDNELLKEGTTIIKMMDSIDTTLSDYEAKELEKIRLRLTNAREMAFAIYQELCLKIRDGMGILEAFNILKQKYREEHAVNMASVYLGKDLQEVELKEREIRNLSEKIEDFQEALRLKDIEISKREDSLYNLRSTITNKENELRLLKEESEKIIDDLQAQTKIAIHDLQQVHKEEKEEFEESLLQSDELIARQEMEINSLKDQVEQNKNSFKALESKLDNISSENRDLFAENKQIKSDLSKEKENSKKQEEMLEHIKLLNENLVVQNKGLYNENALLNKSLGELKELLEDLKSKNKELQENVDNLQKDYKELTNGIFQEIKAELNKNSKLGDEAVTRQSKVKEMLKENKQRRQ